MAHKVPADAASSNELLEHYRDLVETSQDLIWQCDAEQRYTYLNPAWETTFGYTIEEMLGKKFTDFQTPEWAQRDIEEFKRLMNGNIVKGLKTVHIGKTGNEIHLVFNAKFVRDKSGKIIGTRGTAYDNTAFLKAEEALKKTSNLFRAMIDNAPLGAHLYELLPDNNLIFSGANHAADKILQVDNSQFIGKKIEDAFPNLAATDVPDNYRQVARTGLPFNMEQIFYSDDQGISGAFEISAFQTEANKMAVLFRDITEKKKVQEALRASERRFKELVRNASDSVTILDKNGMQIYVSDVVEKMLGYHPSELINIPVIEKMIHAEDRPRVEEAFQKVLRNEKGIVQYRHRHKNGTWVHLEAWASNQLENPDIRGIVVNVRDISERIQAAAEHEKLNQQINQMQKLESLGLLAGGIAHDFNNLMSGIFGYIDLASCFAKDPEVNDYLNKALATINRARSLTQQLLTFAKGGSPIQKVGSLFPCIRGAVEFALSGSNVSVQFDIQENLWHCNFDKNQISQVVDNIVINALHAMPTGGSIELSVLNVMVNDNKNTKLSVGNYVRISIRDHGIGIPQELLPRIFDPFFTTKSKGHGLGLATSYSIVKRHGGAIDVESTPGKGSTFHIYLPAVLEGITSETVQKNIQHLGTGTFIIMDDEEVIRDTMGSMLKSIGYSVKCTSNGKEALDLLDTETRSNQLIAGLILDLTVPGGMGGKDIIDEIRKTNSKMAVFVVSGYADDPVMQNPSEYGFTASICKPFTKKDLTIVLSKYLPQCL